MSQEVITPLSFEDVYRDHYRMVYCLCLRMLKNEADAEDITQDAFIKIYKKLGSFRGDSKLTTWLHQIAVNEVLMYFRKNKRRINNELLTDTGVIIERPLSINEIFETPQIIDHIALSRAIAKLPRGYRNVFLLHDVHGYEHEEVARILGVTAGTSKSQLHKARLKLRGLLKKHTKIRVNKSQSLRKSKIGIILLNYIFKYFLMATELETMPRNTPRPMTKSPT